MLLPKPTKEDRKRARLDTTDLALPKSHFDRDSTYRAWVRLRACLMKWEGRCEGNIEAAHLMRGGRGIKGSDYSYIPLCQGHHRLLDGNSLDFEVLAYLWMRCWELREEYRRRVEK